MFLTKLDVILFLKDNRPTFITPQRIEFVLLVPFIGIFTEVCVSVCILIQFRSSGLTDLAPGVW
jgi:hypothetical protein